MTKGPSSPDPRNRTVPAGRRLLAAKGAYLLLSLGAAFVVLEAGLRLAGPGVGPLNSSALYYDNPRGYYELVAMDGARPVYGLRYNSDRRGFRLPDGPVGGGGAGEAGRVGIVMLGDSFTFGRGVRYADTCAARLEKLLAAEGGGLTVFNAGVVGVGAEEVERVYLEAGRAKKPRLAVYGFVLNDFGLDLPGGRPASDLIDGNNAPPSAGLRKYSAVVDRFAGALERRGGTRATVKAYREAFSGAEAGKKFAVLRRLNAEVKADGGRLVIMLYPLLYSLRDYPFREAHAALREFCAAEGIPFLDLLPAFAVHGERKLWAASSDQHPNELAQEIAAGALAAFLKERGLIPGAGKKAGG